MNETTITLRGRLTADPEIRFTPSGAAVANLTIATNPRTFNKQAGQWEDGPASFYRCSIWRDAAENVAESLSRGDAVVAVGVIAQREYDTKEGEKRSTWEVTLDGIGPDLRWATAKPVRAQRAATGAASTDPWATSGASSSQGWGQPATTEEAPF